MLSLRQSGLSDSVYFSDVKSDEPHENDVILEPGTIDDLVADATDAGYKATHRLVHDWVAKGLIDRPERRRVGRSGSSKAIHSPVQRLLFGELMAQRAEGSSIRDLTDVIIGIWATIDGCVPTRQALRALKTFIGDPRRSKVESQRTAVELTKPLTDDPRLGTARDRREFLYAVRDVFYTGRIDKDLLRERSRTLFDPIDTYVSVVHERGITAAADIDTFVLHLEMIVAAGQSVSSGRVTETHLDQARLLMLFHLEMNDGRVGMADLIAILGLFALDPDSVHRELKPHDTMLDYEALKGRAFSIRLREN